MLLVKYRAATGAILAVWEATDADLLNAQREPAESEIGYLLSTSALSAREMARFWYIVDGAEVPKDEVTFAATPSPFTADGVTTCTVSLTPFTPCTVRVDGTDVVLTDGDPDVILTSDVPHLFRLTLAPAPSTWALPLLVEAE